LAEKNLKTAEQIFILNLKRLFLQDIKLSKIYFQKQEANFEQTTESIFVSHLVPNPTNPDLILHKDRLKEYGNQAPVIRRPKFDLKSTEALLEYKSHGKSYFFKINNPKKSQ
jgi:hypothetical protein